MNLPRNNVAWAAPLALLILFSPIARAADEATRPFPKPQTVRVAGIALKWLRGDKEANYQRIEPRIREAAAHGAQIVCTTECFLDGYAIADKSIPLEQYRALGELIPQGEYFRKLAGLAKELHFDVPLTPRLELSVVERSGVARQGEPITSGVPFPKGELRRAEQVRLLRNGQEVPAQFRAAGLWRPDDSVRWLLVDFQTDLAAHGRQTYTIEYGEGVSAKAKSASGVRIEERDDRYVVDTGAARFDINKRAFDLFHEVRLADGTVIVPRPSASEPRFGAVLRGLKPMVTRAIPDPANQGRSHLIYVVGSPSAGWEDYTLRFTSSADRPVAELTSATLKW